MSTHTYEIVRSPEGVGWLILLDGEPYIAMRTRRQCRKIIRIHKRPIRIMVEL